MNKKKLYTIISLIIVFFITLACDVSCSPDRNRQDDALALQLTRQAIQMTQQALKDADDAANQPPPADEGSPPPASPPEEEPEEEEDETPCNRSKFVSETIADHTVFQPGDTFEKTWTERNIGSCAWNTDYKFKFTQGDRMDGAASQNLPSVVDPNETITMSLNLIAPNTPGTYTGRWEFFDDDGDNFGWYSVVIDVQSAGPPPSSFAVTSVTLWMPHSWIDMGCPGAVGVKADITVSAAGTVTYRWEDTGGGSSSTQSWTFAAAGNKIVDYTTGNFTIDGDYEARIYIDNPNHQWFGPISFHINCTP